MQLTRITDENLEYFRPLLPEEGIDPWAEGLGVIGDDDRPCAASLARLEQDEIAVEWLFVHPEYRNRGIGSHLLRAMEVYGSQKAQAIRISFPDAAEDLETFFWQEGYYVTKTEEILSISLKEDIRKEEVKKLFLMKTKKDVRALQELDPKELRAFSGYLRRRFGTDSYLTGCSRDYSFCIRNEEKEYEGCLLNLDLHENEFQVVLLANQGDRGNILEMLREFLLMLKVAEREEVYLRFYTPNESLIRYVETMSVDPEAIERCGIRCAVKAISAA